MQNVSTALFEWPMAIIPVGWPPANIAAANMQVSVSIRGDRRLASLCATLCGRFPYLSTNVSEETMRVPLRGGAIDVKSIVASKSLHETSHRVCAPVVERTASLVPRGKVINSRFRKSSMRPQS